MYRVPSSLTVYTVSDIVKEGLSFLAKEEIWTVSFRDLHQSNSAGLLACLAWRRAAKAQGKRLLLKDIPSTLQELMRLTHSEWLQGETL
jgi:ABC-type transporter Mla MlaB component